jgi:hypothetical protein
MSDERLLLLVLAALYLSECSLWVGHGSVALRAAVGRRFGVVHPPAFPGNDRGGWVVLNPLPPLGSAFACHQWPVALTAAGVGPATGQSVNFSARPTPVGADAGGGPGPADPPAYRWEAVRGARADGDVVHLDLTPGGERPGGGRPGDERRSGGRPFVKLADAPAAARLADLVARLAAAPAARRPRMIDRVVRASFDVAAAAERAARVRRATVVLRGVCVLLFLLLFVAVPALVALGLFSFLILRLLPLAVACWWSAVALFYLAHRELAPADRAGRWKAVAVMLFAPTAAIRACDAAGKQALAGVDPVAAAAALCRPEAFATFARRALLDLHFPLAADVAPAAEPRSAGEPQSADETLSATETLSADEARAAAAEFRATLAGHVARVMAAKGVDPAAALSTPAAADPAHLSYCPRCRAEYVVPTGTCQDCGGLALRPLAGAVRTDAVIVA